MANKAWIGVDFDGTLAHYDGWKGEDHLGEPVPAMLERVKDWLARGKIIKIVTARVSATGRKNDVGGVDSEEFADKQRRIIGDWCEKHLGQRLEVTASKDFLMLELWDDRAITVEFNTGKLFCRCEGQHG